MFLGIDSSNSSAQFDDITDGMGAANLLRQIGLYRSLDWITFFTQTPTEVQRQVITGLQPQSSANYASFGNATALKAVLTSKYSGTKVDHYTPSTFYYGCFEGTANQAVIEPVLCDFTFNGYSKGTLVASQAFNYNPGSGLVVKTKLAKGTFSKSFADIDTLILNDPENLDTIPVVDSFSYTTYNVTK